MRIGGLLRFSLIDFPGKVAAVVFTQGCNFRCRYCHNPELIPFRSLEGGLDEYLVLDFLEKRRGYLDGVVITGGEPTLQKDLVAFVGKIKEMDFLVKLDTNGSSPQVLGSLIEMRLVDFIAMDIKAPLESYEKVAGVKVPEEILRQSIQLVLTSKLPYEFRTTLVKSLHSPEDIGKITLALEGAQRLVIQPFTPSPKILDHSLIEEESFSSRELDDFKSRWRKISFRGSN